MCAVKSLMKGSGTWVWMPEDSQGCAYCKWTVAAPCQTLMGAAFPKSDICSGSNVNGSMGQSVKVSIRVGRMANEYMGGGAGATIATITTPAGTSSF